MVRHESNVIHHVLNLRNEDGDVIRCHSDQLILKNTNKKKNYAAIQSNRICLRIDIHNCKENESLTLENVITMQDYGGSHRYSE